MDSRTWRQIGRGALAGAVAGAALAAAGLRVGMNGALQPARVQPWRGSSRFPEPPFDAPEPPPSRSEETRAMVTQAFAGAALGALFGFLRTRSDRLENPVESNLYGVLLSTLGLGAWLAPLGLLGGGADLTPEERASDWAYRQESLLDDAHPPYQAQPPYDPEAPYDVF
jgi:hypothetical protein